MFDDGIITIDDGFISVDGEMVSGSRQWVRDPRLHHPTGRMVEAAFRRSIAASPFRLLPEGTKWCCCPYHKEEVANAYRSGVLDGVSDYDLAEQGYMPVNYFGIDRRRFDKRTSWCRVCDAARKRGEYAAKVGRPVRMYQRKGGE